MTDNGRPEFTAEEAEKMNSYAASDIDAITIEQINGALQHYLDLRIFTRVGVPTEPDRVLLWAVTLADGAEFTFTQKCDIIAFIDGMLAMTNAQDALTQKMFGALFGKQQGKKK